MPEFNRISELRKLLDASFKLEKEEPPVYASDAEINTVKLSMLYQDGKSHTIKAHKEEATPLRVHKNIQ